MAQTPAGRKFSLGIPLLNVLANYRLSWLIDLHQHFGNFWQRLKKIRVLILVKKAVKMS